MTSGLRSFRPQLAERIRPGRLEKYFPDDQWVMQPKLDGVRLALVAEGGSVYGINRKGLTAIPHPSLTAALKPYQDHQLVLDGEWVDGVLWCFDVPYAFGQISPTSPYIDRALAVEMVINDINHDKIRPVNFISGETKKRELVKAVQRDRGEGVMLRDLQGPYLRGKRSSRLLKCKFVETVDVIVMVVGREGKSSMAVGLLDPKGDLVNVGSVTLSQHWMDTLEVGQVVEVEYLYSVNRDRPRLYQPVMKRQRPDKPILECGIEQLKFTDKSVKVY